jgi:hypothetical protein
MLRRGTFRLFSTVPNLDPRIEKLKGTSISPEQIVIKPGKRLETDRLKTAFPDRFKAMKEQFGEDYKTPDERFDLHFPRVEATGEKSAYERHNERQGYRKGKVVGWLTVIILGGGMAVAMMRFYWDYTSQKMRFEEKKKEKEFLRANWYGIPNELREERLAEVAKLKATYKEKYGVEADDHSLSN